MAKKDSQNKDENVDPKLEEIKEAVHRIVDIDISKEMKQSYINYAMSVITDRALPDARDGLKPVHRRILYSMHQNGLTSSARFRKSATVVGDVLGSFHPHGDASVYDAMVKMAQEFSYRYPLIWGQGNFGSIDGDGAAAYRYTEAKMSKISSEILRDIEKDTIDMKPNFDGTKKEPTVFPTAVPNLLLNGTLGIAVGMATNIPPHNLSELIDASIHLIENKDATTEDLCEIVTGPDFPTGGVIYGKSDIAHAYATGRGGIVTRGEADIVELKNGNYQIIITSIPYRVVKSTLIEKIADLVREKKIEGIKGLRDESTKDIRIAIDLKGGIEPQKVLNYLYKHTQLEDTFHVNLVCLVDGVPQTLNLKSSLEEFLKHRKVVVRRRTEFELRKAEDREHILLGLKKALDHIDEIIKLIRKSKSVEEAHTELMKQFKFSTVQAQAILDMKLQRLAGLERKKIEDELKEVQDFIAELKEILASEKKMQKIIKDELLEIKAKYGDDRRTKVVKYKAKEFNPEDLIAEKEAVLVYTSGGYIKRTDPDEFKTQKRGGVGVVDLNTKEEDFISISLTTNTHSDLLFFTDKGKAYQMKMYEVPEGKRATRGKSIMNYLQISSEENITSILPMPKDTKDMTRSLAMITRDGTIKKSSAESFKDVRRSGIIAIKLEKNDNLIGAFLTDKGDEVMLATSLGQAIRFKESDIRQMGRSAGGVRGMKLGKGDEVIGVGVIKKDNKNGFFLTVSEHGFGKKTSTKEYKVQKRGGSGIKTAKVTTKTGKLIVGKVLDGDEEELIAMSKKGQVIRTPLSDISALGRQTQGVTVMRLRTGDSIASLVCV